MEIYSIGFTKKSASEFFGALKAAGIERLQAVWFLSSRGKKYDGRFGQLFVLPNLTAQIEAADPGQHNIEQKQRWLRPGRHWNDRRTGEKCRNLITCGSQIVFNQLRYVRVILDDIDEVRISRLACHRQSSHRQKESLTNSRKPCLKRALSLIVRL